MLRAFCVDNLAVTIEDLYFRDPDPDPGQQGDERGVRVELRVREPQRWRGTIYAAQRVVVDQAVWRADFLESVAAGPGSKDRMHHHPNMIDSEPGKRTFSKELTADPIAFLEARLADPLPLLEAAKVPGAGDYEESAVALREALPEIVEAVSETLEGVRAGRLATRPNAP